jgi:hypothetical protein
MRFLLERSSLLRFWIDVDVVYFLAMESTGGKPGFFHRVLAWASSRRFHAGLATAAVVVGSFLIADRAFAGGFDDLGKWALGQLGTFLNVIIEFLGNLIILLTNILIEFASYNNFVRAAPVEIGWVLMRDVVNMFFIVVLLVSAFSTIIGYSEFHYSKVLPKLLLMAVLINFSKTLIGLLIDFSQVLMLTFVNAFKPAAGGNFVNLLKLSKATNLRTDLENVPDSESLVNLLVASLLAIFMLTIVLTILVIMIAFILYRIIGLWMILIMSPMAFFALALPGKMAKGFSAFTSKFWDRLGNFLIAGPVMAFFIWLALAIAQGGSGFSDLYNRQSTEVTTATAGFINEIGKPEEIASFIVAIAFLLAGVEFAVSTAKAVSPTLGNFASSVSHGGGAIVNIPRYAARLTSRTARVGAGVAQRGFGAADFVTRGHLRGAVGRAGLAVSREFGGVGAATFADMATYKARKIKAKKGELAKITADLDPATRDAYLRGRASSGVFSKEAAAAQISLAETATSSVGLKARKKMLEAEIKAANPGLSDAETAALVEARANALAAMDVKTGKEAAERIGDDAAISKFKEAVEKNPSLNTDWSSFESIKGAAIEDPKEYLKKVGTDSMKDSRTAIAHMRALGLIDDNGNFVREGEGVKEKWDTLMSGDRGKLVQAHVDAYQGRAADVQAMMRAMDGDKASEAQANAARHYATVKDGYVGSVFFSGAATQPAAQPVVNVRNEQVITAGRETLQQLAQQNVAANAPAAQAVQRDMMAAGATLAEAFQFNTQAAAFQTQQHAESFNQVIQQAAQQLGSQDAAQQNQGLAYYRNLDMEAVRQEGQNGYNEARAAVIANTTSETLRRGFDRAVQMNDDQAREKIFELTEIIRKEAERSRRIVQGVNAQELRDLLQNPQTGASQAVLLRMRNAGATTREQALSAARATLLKSEIESDESFRAIRNEVEPLARRRAQRAEIDRAAGFRRRRGQNQGNPPPPANP